MNKTKVSKLKSNLIGDRQFYSRMLVIVIPIIIQNTITNVVSLLDNVMVGRVGTLEMSAVAIDNQLLFVFNICIFGGLSDPQQGCHQRGGGAGQEIRGCGSCQVCQRYPRYLPPGRSQGVNRKKSVHTLCALF